MNSMSSGVKTCVRSVSLLASATKIPWQNRITNFQRMPCDSCKQFKSSEVILRWGPLVLRISFTQLLMQQDLPEPSCRDPDLGGWWLAFS